MKEYNIGLSDYRSDSAEAEARMMLAYRTLNDARQHRDELNETIREELLPAYELAKRAAHVYGHKAPDTTGKEENDAPA